MYSTGTHVCFLKPVNLPAPLPTVTSASPSLLHNLLCSVKSSSQTDQARQHDNRKDFFILFGVHGLPSLFTVFIKKSWLSQSITVAVVAPDPGLHAGEAARDTAPIYFSDIPSS